MCYKTSLHFTSKLTNSFALPSLRRSILRLVESTMPRRFRSSGNSALWSIRFKRTGAAGLSGCWGTRSAKVMMRGGDFAAH